MPKDALLYQRLCELGIATADRTFTPVPPDFETLCLAHDADYVQSFLDGTISDAGMRCIGLPWSKDLVTRTLIGTGSAILASRLALDLGIAVMCNGGTHHAHPGHGSGWCIFNDQAVAARSVQRDCSVGQTLFIDLDVHQGDGTAAIFHNDSSVFTFSMHCEAQSYPAILQKSDVDIPLPAGCDDLQYISTLQRVLPSLLKKVQPELVMYNAGADVHADDSLGKMALSNEGILERDRLVMKLCSEAGSVLCAAIGGGYEPDHNKIVERHVMLHKAAAEYADAFLLNTKRAKKWAAKEEAANQILNCQSTHDNASSTSTATSVFPITLPSHLFIGDLLRITLPSGKDFYLEIMKCRPTTSNGGSGGGGDSSTSVVIEALCEGEMLRMQPNTGTIEHVGYWPRLSDAWVKQFPTLQTALKSLRQKYQENPETLPSSLLNLAATAITGSLLSAEGAEKEVESTLHIQKVTSLSEFETLIASNPSFWCDGTAPNDPIPTSEQTALLSAGELFSFLQGLRGVLLVQLEMSVKTTDLRVPLPLLRPFVLRVLQRVVENKKEVLVLPSTAPGGGAASLVVAAKQQPYKAWGARLAEIGVQAALIADSPYYKMLVGRILGYKEENIIHHIESYGQKLEPRVAAAVKEELEGLSSVPPRLPWTSKRK
ncbi:hypothetical protein KSW81_004537 [Nannochloris sp. 'desiccata']|nr:hypothetical protein KSW81_004537 [Chlorella desiccata (nom. nud.)]